MNISKSKNQKFSNEIKKAPSLNPALYK